MIALPPAATTVVSAPATDAEQCQASLARRIGEIGTFSPGLPAMTGLTTVIEGVVDRLVKPESAKPGMMAPTHVLVTRYSFRCALRSGVVRHVSLHKYRD